LSRRAHHILDVFERTLAGREKGETVAIRRLLGIVDVEQFVG